LVSPVIILYRVAPRGARLLSVPSHSVERMVSAATPAGTSAGTPAATPAGTPDPAEALRDFAERVSPYDPDPTAARGTVELRWGHAAERITLTPHLARALQEALSRYRDPADRGRCAGCGGRRLDDNLHCRDCGRLHGVLGAVIADRAERIRRGGGGSEG
jgi:hypothetical protein